MENMKDHKKPWFKYNFFWGIFPVSKEGWLVSVGLILAVVGIFWLRKIAVVSEQFAAAIALLAIFTTAIIAIAKGESYDSSGTVNLWNKGDDKEKG